MSFFIDDGSNVSTFIDAPEGKLEFTFRPPTARETQNWVWAREKLPQGDVDCEYIAKHLVTLAGSKATVEQVGRLRNHLFVRVLNIINGDDSGDDGAKATSPDKQLGN